jgi:hypothetical protein
MKKRRYLGNKEKCLLRIDELSCFINSNPGVFWIAPQKTALKVRGKTRFFWEIRVFIPEEN